MGSSTVAPLAIGTRGTVGSLVRKEIEYFQRAERELVRSASTGDTPRSKTATLGSLLMGSWRRKKRRRTSSYSYSYSSSSGSSGFVSSEEFDGIPGFSYKNLKVDVLP